MSKADHRLPRSLRLAACGTLGLGLLGTLAACGADGPTGPSTPRLSIVAGDSARDTIGTRLPLALRVRLTDGGGAPLSGRLVRFTALRVPLLGKPGVAQVSLTPLTATVETDFLSDTTDSRGEAAVLIRLGPFAGKALVTIGEPIDGLVDTATYTVTAGAPAAIRLSTTDTTVYVSGTASVSATVVDRYNNPRADQPTFTATVPAIADVTGNVATGRQLGIGGVVASLGGVTATMRVVVVPRATLAALGPSGIVVFDADGSGMRSIASGEGTMTSWSPDGADVVADATSGALRIASLTGTVRLLPSTGGWSLYPKYSADGVWIYYSEGTDNWQLRRIHPDGTGDVALPRTPLAYETAPAPSPDGTRVAFVATGGTPLDDLWMLDLASGATTDLHVSGHLPSWSPIGDLIAYLPDTYGGPLHVMSPDGSGQRVIGVAGNSYGPGIGWSPDGAWIVARDATIDRIELIQLGTGLVLPLGQYTAALHGPAWRP